GDVAALVLPDRAGLLAEHVPDRRAFSVGGGRALDLVGGGGRAPDEALRKLRQAGGRSTGVAGTRLLHGERGCRSRRGPAEKVSARDRHRRRTYTGARVPPTDGGRSEVRARHSRTSRSKRSSDRGTTTNPSCWHLPLRP